MTPHFLPRSAFLALTLTFGTTQAVTCIPPKSMAQGRLPASPLLKYDCAATQDLKKAYSTSKVKPNWVEVYRGPMNKASSALVARLFTVLKKEGFKVEVDASDPDLKGFTFKKGKLVLGGSIIVAQLISTDTPGELVFALVGR